MSHNDFSIFVLIRFVMESGKFTILFFSLFIHVCMSAEGRGGGGVSFHATPPRLDWSELSINSVSFSLSLDDPDLVQPISISFETPAGIRNLMFFASLTISHCAFHEYLWFFTR